MASGTRRITRVLIALALAAGGVLAAGAPAAATADHCETYLRNWGYAVGPKAQHACAVGAGWEGATRCVILLMDIGVTERRAETACYYAEQ